MSSDLSANLQVIPKLVAVPNSVDNGSYEIEMN